jgi:hypothetical protein
MKITSTKLTFAAGVSAALAGLLYILIQFIHPHEDLATVTSTSWVVVAGLTALMALLALVGITGLYLRQIEQMGVLGLVGFLIYGAFFLLVIGYSFIEVFVLPQLADDASQWVSDSLALFANDPIEGDLGPLKALNPIAAVMYLFGGLLFGIALYRARVLARWATVLLAAGTAATPLVVTVLPHSAARMAAIPVGIALAGLGYSLMRDQRGGAVLSLRSARLDTVEA